MTEKTGIETFLKLAKKYVVLDVRSPGEYCQAHIPGAYNLPLFSDEERKTVGTVYKQQNREEAIKIGLDFFGTKMRKMVEEVEKITNSEFRLQSFAPVNVENATNFDDLTNNGTISDLSNTVLVHCWRGGMRSAGVAWLLDLYGFKVYTLAGGYKAFRNWVLRQFEIKYPLRVLGGYTGSGKTDILKELVENDCRVIDLEGIARHKGSAFGALGNGKQPTQEMFENELAMKLNEVFRSLRQDENIWVEDESRRIGDVNIPGALWDTMRSAPLFFLEVPFEERLEYITKEYGKFDTTDLVNSVTRIHKRLGGLAAKQATSFLQEGNTMESFRILLCYYDKYYASGLQARDDAYHNITRIVCDTVDTKNNSRKLVDK